MRTIRNRFRTLFCAAGLVLGTAFAAAGSTAVYAYDYLMYGKYVFEDYGDYLKLCEYDGEGSVLDIPSEVNKKPVTSIDKRAFCSCDTLTYVTVPDSVTYIGREAFSCCDNLKKVTLPDDCYLEKEAFRSCGSLEKINIPKETYRINDGVFAYCTSLKNITLPEGLERIGEAAFCGCSSLESITIPESVIWIHCDSFDECSSLKTFTVPKGCIDLFAISDYDAYCFTNFTGCTSLEAINVEPGNTEYASFDGCLYNKDMTELLKCPEGKKSVSFPKTITTIGKYACERLNMPKLVLPEGLKVIDDYAFTKCGNIDITFPKSLKYIEYAAFCHSRLTHVTFPACELSVGMNAFTDCKELRSVVIPDSGIGLKSEAFSNCDKLMTVVLPRSLTRYSFKDKQFGYKMYYSWEHYSNSYQYFPEFRWSSDVRKTPIVFICYEGSDAAAYAEENGVEYKIIPSVEKKGDSDGNGKVNMKDLVSLQRKLNGFVMDIINRLADFNGDGVVNMKDFVILQRYLNGWFIHEALPQILSERADVVVEHLIDGCNAAGYSTGNIEMITRTHEKCEITVEIVQPGFYYYDDISSDTRPNSQTVIKKYKILARFRGQEPVVDIIDLSTGKAVGSCAEEAVDIISVECIRRMRLSMLSVQMQFDLISLYNTYSLRKYIISGAYEIVKEDVTGIDITGITITAELEDGRKMPLRFGLRTAGSSDPLSGATELYDMNTGKVLTFRQALDMIYKYTL